MKKLPTLFMIIHVKEQPVRAVFHGTMSEAQLKKVMEMLGTAEGQKIRLSIVEKLKDSDYHYTILTLACDRPEALDKRLYAVFPIARRVLLSEKTPLREAVRAIVIT
jgi:hypothetical protein